MPGWVSATERQPWKAASKKGGASRNSRHARVRPSFPNHASVIPVAPGLARWATSGLFQLKPATPASTALAVLPMPAMSPCTHVPRYPGTLAVFVWLAVRRVGRGSLTHANSLDGRWVPIQLTLVCLSPEVPWFLLLDAFPPRQPPPPVPFPVGVLPGRRSPVRLSSVVGTSTSCSSSAVQSVVIRKETIDDRIDWA